MTTSIKRITFSIGLLTLISAPLLRSAIVTADTNADVPVNPAQTVPVSYYAVQASLPTQAVNDELSLVFPDGSHCELHYLNINDNTMSTSLSDPSSECVCSASQYLLGVRFSSIHSVTDSQSAHLLTNLASGDSSPRGLEVTEVFTGLPADLAGIVKGDFIVAINNHRVRSLSHVIDLINESCGQEVTVLVHRQNEDLTFYISPVSVQRTAGLNLPGQNPEIPDHLQEKLTRLGLATYDRIIGPAMLVDSPLTPNCPAMAFKYAELEADFLSLQTDYELLKKSQAELQKQLLEAQLRVAELSERTVTSKN